jgi:4-alpha-glucanotransferase
MPDAPPFAAGDAEEVEFVEFVQWTADRQLGAASALARRLGMKVGLYLDVAVGVQADGFDAWNEQAAISRHLGVGAPPDPLNTAGQSWGLAGFNAVGLELESFAPYRDMLRASMRHAGAISSTMCSAEAALSGAARLQRPRRRLCPDAVRGAAGGDRAKALLNRCVVIGDPRHCAGRFSRPDRRWGIWSYLVMMFERDDGGSFRHIDHYLTNALVTFTHDLSTYAGWRSFGDLKLKRSLGIDPVRATMRAGMRWRCSTTCCVITPSTATISIH